MWYVTAGVLCGAQSCALVGVGVGLGLVGEGVAVGVPVVGVVVGVPVAVVGALVGVAEADMTTGLPWEAFPPWASTTAMAPPPNPTTARASTIIRILTVVVSR
jgi:hypothetical protein